MTNYHKYRLHLWKGPENESNITLYFHHVGHVSPTTPTSSTFYYQIQASAQVGSMKLTWRQNLSVVSFANLLTRHFHITKLQIEILDDETQLHNCEYVLKTKIFPYW